MAALYFKCKDKTGMAFQANGSIGLGSLATCLGRDPMGITAGGISLDYNPATGQSQTFGAVLQHLREGDVLLGTCPGNPILLEGRALGGRASQDGSPPSSGRSVQHPSSPRQQTESDKLTTVALRSFAVQLLQRFPGINEQENCEFPVPKDTDALWFTFDKVLGPAITANLTTELGTEAAIVQMVHLMLQPLVALFPLAPSGSLVTDLDSELADTATLQGDDSKGYSFLFEKPFKAGTFQGKIEVQVVKRKVPKASGHGNVFAGAFEVKQAGSGALTDWIEQARKEAFAMWMWNARFDFYHKVWVVLTNLEQVIYLEYEGTKESFKHPFKVADVKGELRWAGPYQLLNRSGTSYVATLDSLKALWLLVKGMTSDDCPSEQVLQQRLTAAATRAELAMQQCKASMNRKRGREDEGRNDGSREAADCQQGVGGSS